MNYGLHLQGMANQMVYASSLFFQILLQSNQSLISPWPAQDEESSKFWSELSLGKFARFDFCLWFRSLVLELLRKNFRFLSVRHCSLAFEEISSFLGYWILVTLPLYLDSLANVSCWQVRPVLLGVFIFLVTDFTLLVNCKFRYLEAMIISSCIIEFKDWEPLSDLRFTFSFVQISLLNVCGKG